MRAFAKRYPLTSTAVFWVSDPRCVRALEGLVDRRLMKETGQSNGDLTVISALFASGQIMSPTVGFYLARDDEAKTESKYPYT